MLSIRLAAASAVAALLLFWPSAVAAQVQAQQPTARIAAAAFADQLAAHAAEEEQILYPGALLVGAHLRTRR